MSEDESDHHEEDFEDKLYMFVIDKLDYKFTQNEIIEIVSKKTKAAIREVRKHDRESAKKFYADDEC